MDAVHGMPMNQQLNIAAKIARQPMEVHFGVIPIRSIAEAGADIMILVRRAMETVIARAGQELK